MISNRSTKAVALATTLALAISSVGGVALADELADQTQTTAEVATQEQNATEQTDAEATTTETVADTTAEASDKQEAETTQATEDASDDVDLEAMAAEILVGSIVGPKERSVIDPSEVEWEQSTWVVPEGFTYKDDDGYRIYYDEDGWSYRWFKLGEAGELLYPSQSWIIDVAHSDEYENLSFVTANHMLYPILPSAYESNSSYVPSSTQYILSADADVTPQVLDGQTLYRYEGGKYGPAGTYALIDTEYYGKQHIGDYIQYWSGGGEHSGTSSTVEGTHEAPFQAAAANVTYTSPTVEAAATDTASAAASATPATGDASSLAAAFVAAFGAMGAFVSAKAMRRE